MHSKGNANSRFGRLKAVGQVSFSSLSESYACSEVFRSSPIGLDSQCFLGDSSRQELCAYFPLRFLCRGSLGRRSHLRENEIWINIHDEPSR